MFEPECINPIAARKLLPHTKEREYAELCLKRLWHVIFDPCPTLSQMITQDQFEIFLTQGRKKIFSPPLTTDWMIHLEFYDWLKKTNTSMTPEVLKELGLAAVSKACVSLSPLNPGLGIGLPELPTQIFMGWKSQSLDIPRKTAILNLSQPFFETKNQIKLKWATQFPSQGSLIPNSDFFDSKDWLWI